MQLWCLATKPTTTKVSRIKHIVFNLVYDPIALNIVSCTLHIFNIIKHLSLSFYPLEHLEDKNIETMLIKCLYSWNRNVYTQIEISAIQNSSHSTSSYQNRIKNRINQEADTHILNSVERTVSLENNFLNKRENR